MTTDTELAICDSCGEVVPCELYCGTCDTEHCLEGECATVDCTDCECEHAGHEDKCLCQKYYCEECGCEPEAYWDDGQGCAACYWNYEQTSSADPCDYGSTEEAYEGCAYYSKYIEVMDDETPKGDGKFSVRRLEAVKPEEVDATHEHAVAKQLGLDPHMDLSKACADFYILERLYHNSHELSSSYVNGKPVLRPLYPVDFGKDTAAERAAYAIARTRQSMAKELSRQLLTYMIMAVGGELRHAKGQAYKVTRKRGTPKKQWPKSKEKEPWRFFLQFKQYKESDIKLSQDLLHELRKRGCAACLDYVKKNPGDQAYTSPCNREYINKKGHIKIRPATEANPTCSYFPVWCDIHKIVAPKETFHHYEPHTTRVNDFLEWNRYKLTRGLAWREWLKLYTQHGPVLIKDCEDVFRRWQWNGSYGGPKWGEAAHFAFEFAAGRMSNEAFLDRVWTLEHNGGNLFNKFYRRGTNELLRILQIQADDEEHYPKLIKHASPYTQELYRNAERLGLLKRNPTIVWG